MFRRTHRDTARAPRVLLALACAALVGCTGTFDGSQPGRAAIADSTLPPAKAFAAAHPQPPQRANRDIARDFLDLHFNLEGGGTLPVFTRFDGPITLRVTGAPPPGFEHELTRLLARLRNEAGIDITRVNGDSARITIETVSRKAIRKALPKAACFVVPNVTSLRDFRRKRRSPDTDWTRMRQRDNLALFLPSDVSPQELRDCLHEELAQALGPLNDLYRLSDSVFNDDNVHTVLTGFDMLILRATYAPELRTGMTRAEVAARLPGILARLNPRGQGIPPRPLPATPRRWIAAIETALGPDTRLSERRLAARTAVEIGRASGWRDHRQAQGLYVLGRLIQADAPDSAQALFASAMEILRGQPGTELHQARIRPRMAAYAIARGQPDAALTLLEPVPEIAARYENAALLSTALMMQAEALDLAGQFDAASAVRLDSLGWARYGFGPDWAVRAKLREVANLRPH
ncbi:DUF2927 domain-containing protein [Pseudophaeobacter sp. C1-32P7]|uniref:DUF2927 domain-containing protein n=1 Tax=Pseudophaeobacter sp. C1-32P7 TaxID=3098142 RepID=UPI0034D4ECF7